MTSSPAVAEFRHHAADYITKLMKVSNTDSSRGTVDLLQVDLTRIPAENVFASETYLHGTAHETKDF